MAGGLDKPVVHFVHSEQNHKASQSILTAVGLASLQPRAVASAENGDGGARQTRRARLPAKGSGP